MEAMPAVLNALDPEHKHLDIKFSHSAYVYNKQQLHTDVKLFCVCVYAGMT